MVLLATHEEVGQQLRHGVDPKEWVLGHMGRKECVGQEGPQPRQRDKAGDATGRQTADSQSRQLTGVRVHAAVSAAL